MANERESLSKLVIGCGYLGERVARRWLADGVPVTVLTRSASRAERLSAEGFQSVVGDVLQPESLEQLPSVQTVLYAVGFDRSARVSKREVYVTGLRNVLSVLRGRCRKLLYVSSTSVYGQNNGEVVDETSPTEPTEENGCICRDAEAVVQEFFPRDSNATHGAVILRLAGLYGPGRFAARLEKLRRGERLEGSAAAWLNLIHVDDAVQAVLAAEEFGHPGECYLICDDQPVLRSEYFAELTRQLGLPAPEFELPETKWLSEKGSGTFADNQQSLVFPSSSVVSRGFLTHFRTASNTVPSATLNKRCSNRRMRGELNVELQFPTFVEGLKSIPELRR